MRAVSRCPARLAWVAAALVLLAGCGELGEDYTGTRPASSTPITLAAVARYGPGTPERTLLAWCRTLQRRDSAAARRFYAPAIRRDAETMRQEILSGTFVFAVQTCPSRLRTSIDGRAATVFAELRRRQVAPNGRVDATVAQQAFNLERQRDGEWTVVPGGFLVPLAFPPAVPEGSLRRPRVVSERDLAAHPAGGPVRGALSLLRLLQYNDPVRARAYFGPEWPGLTTDELAKQMKAFSYLARSWRVPRPSSVRRHGRTATLRVKLGNDRALLVLGDRQGRWQVLRFRYGGVDLPKRTAGR